MDLSAHTSLAPLAEAATVYPIVIQGTPDGPDLLLGEHAVLRSLLAGPW
jgi:hypothetical protein